MDAVTRVAHPSIEPLMKRISPALALVLSLLALRPALCQSAATSVAGEDLARRSRAVLAQTSGSIKLKGLRKPVEVLRDAWGVPHIYAQTTEDLFFAQGFVAAQDRLWQMEVWRRAATGTLAEVVGPAAVERDKFARLIRYRGDMEREFKSYAPDAQLIIESFVRGVNAYIDSARDRLPIEFQLLNIHPEPWTPEICISRMAVFPLMLNANGEVARSQIVHALGTSQTDALLETDPPQKLEVPEGLDLSGIDSSVTAIANAALGPVVFGMGSNNWVVSGDLTATGKPILANDPHREISVPSLRYLVHLNAPGWNVIGAGEPALPGVAVGHNERIGFGFTIFLTDQQDLYVEETHPKDPTLYRYKGRWERMVTRHESIMVKGKAEPERVELRWTRHGPVLREDAARRRAYALRWVGSEPGTAGYLASLSVARARNWREFLAALERWKTPGENMLYADVEGNIGWQAAALVPVRSRWPGLLPIPGGSGDFEWTGFLPLSELPRAYNPANHFIATANNRVIPEGFPHVIGFGWAPPYRFMRIEEVLRAGRRFTVRDFKRLQLDEKSLPAGLIVPLLRGVRADDPNVREAARLLLEWDQVVSKGSTPAAIYEVWLTRLHTNVFQPRVPAALFPVVRNRFTLPQLINLLNNPDSKSFGPAPSAGRDKVLVRSLAEATSELRARLGPDMMHWRWGDLHRATFQHVLSNNEERRAVFDLAPVARGGDANTVNATDGPNFLQRSGASFRQILDLSDWDNSVAISAPGQSGQPQSPHYADLLPLWAEGRYFPLLFSRSRVEEGTRQRLLLEPASPRR